MTTLPATIELASGMTLSPNEMRRLKEETGRTLTDLLGGDEADMDQAPDRIQALVWTELRRRGFEVSFEEVGDVRPVFVAPAPDPTNGGASPTSPPFAIGTE